MRAESEPIATPSSWPVASELRARVRPLPVGKLRAATGPNLATTATSRWLDAVAELEDAEPALRLRDEDGEPVKPACDGCARCSDRKRETRRARPARKGGRS